jgi:hypothetical protein
MGVALPICITPRANGAFAFSERIFCVFPWADLFLLPDRVVRRWEAKRQREARSGA